MVIRMLFRLSHARTVLNVSRTDSENFKEKQNGLYK